MTQLKAILGCHWPVMSGLLIGGFFLGGAAATKGIFSAEMASWVQGVGTVAAVIATWALTTRAHRLEVQGKQQADQEFYRSVLKSTVRFFQSTADIPTFRDNPEYSLIRTWTEGAQQTLRRLEKIEALPVSKWPTPFVGVEFDAYMQRARYLFDRAVKARSQLRRGIPLRTEAFDVHAAWQSYMRQHREFLDLLKPYLPETEILEFRRWEDGSIQ